MSESQRRFEGRLAFVTGAASGIGEATAHLLAAEGARVACADINQPGAEATAKAIGEAGGDAIALHCDVSSHASARDAVEAAVAELGGLDILCNVAGTGGFRKTEEVTPEEWLRVQGVNLNGTFFVSQAALPHLLARKGSSIVNVASLAGLIGQAYCAAYCASKAGVVSLTKVMAIEFLKRGLRVNCVCPGVVQTPIIGDFTPPEDADKQLIGRLFLGNRISQPSEIAAAIAYLASDDAVSINGVALPIDSGVHAG